MGKQSKAQDAEQMRKYREQQRREELEKQKRQNRTIYLIVGVLAAVVVIAAIIGVIVAQTQKKTANKAPTMDQIDLSDVQDVSLFVPSETATDYVKLTVTWTDQSAKEQSGDIYIRLFPDVAPETVTNFKRLVGDGFYNGLTFHRVYPDFMIQGGDPSGDGTGGSSLTIKGEFAKNGFENNLSHKRGVVSMARRGDPYYNSASSQFFIVQGNNASRSLDGGYASFGYVVNGMESVDAITEIALSQGGDPGVATSPVYPVTIVSATFVALQK